MHSLLHMPAGSQLVMCTNKSWVMPEKPTSDAQAKRGAVPSSGPAPASETQQPAATASASGVGPMDTATTTTAAAVEEKPSEPLAENGAAAAEELGVSGDAGDVSGQS